jgi:NAD-dependent dihydropyrimidine dehydrogenase PreA subunit
MTEWVLPDIDLNLCNGCGRCVSYCPTKAVEMKNGKPVITRPADCAYCGMCEEVCPVNAIALSYEIEFRPSDHIE